MANEKYNKRTTNNEVGAGFREYEESNWRREQGGVPKWGKN